MEKFSYQFKNGYLFIEANGLNCLVSTGTPESMCVCGEITVDDRTFPVKQQTLRMSPKMLSEAIQTPLDAVIGADILSRFDYRINPFKKEILLSTDEIHPYGYAAHFNLYRSVPIVNVCVGTTDTKVYFNTGSPISYMLPEIAAKFPQVGISKAFYPGIGWIDTPLHRVLVWMSGNDVELDVGIPSESLLSTLKMTKASGVIGCDVFNGPGVFIASRRREVIWFWHDY